MLEKNTMGLGGARAPCPPSMDPPLALTVVELFLHCYKLYCLEHF